MHLIISTDVCMYNMSLVMRKPGSLAYVKNKSADGPTMISHEDKAFSQHEFEQFKNMNRSSSAEYQV